jgi:hypothetical protein
LRKSGVPRAEGTDHIVDGTRIRFAASRDDGVTWSAPTTISVPQVGAEGTYNIFPWIVADAPGKVAVAWYEGAPPLGYKVNHQLAALTPWYVRVAYSSDADDASPTWTSERATGVVYTGPICSRGTGCVPVSNPVALSRTLLDFFEMAEKPDGTLAIVFAGHQPPVASVATSSTQLYVITQSGGPSLKS